MKSYKNYLNSYFEYIYGSYKYNIVFFSGVKILRCVCCHWIKWKGVVYVKKLKGKGVTAYGGEDHKTTLRSA